MGKLFGNWFSGEGFTLWKLQTSEDYLNFALVLLAGIAVFVLAQGRIDSRRNYKSACARAAKRLERLGGPGAVCYRDVLLGWKRTVQPCPFLYVDGSCVYAVKVFWWGLHVSGSAQGTEWTFTANKETRREPNPLPELKETCVVLSRLLGGSGLHGVEVQPLVVLADNFGSIRHQIAGTACVVACQDLKKWRRAHPLSKEGGYDIRAVKAALEASFQKEGGPAG